MKNLSLILNGILAVAVIYLYILHFKGEKTANSANNAADNKPASGTLPKIAYVNSDTLLAYYDYFKHQRAGLESKANKLQTEYENRAKGLQNEINAYQRTAGQMTMNQARAREEELRKKQQNLLQYQQTLSNQLMEEENKVNEALYQNVASYLEEYGKNQDFKIVLTYTKGSGVLYADDSLDITREVLAGLNEKYKKPDAAGTAKKGATADSTATK